MLKHCFILTLIFFLYLPLYSQDQSVIDSLKKVLETAEHDTTKIKILNQLGTIVIYSNPDTSLILSKRALALLEKTKDLKNKANSLSILGVGYWIKGEFATAIDYFFKAIEIQKKQNNLKGMAGSYNNIATIYSNQSDFTQSLEYYFKALKINSEMGNKQWLSINHNNIGAIYRKQSDYPEALKYYFKSLKIDKEQGDKKGMASSYNNIGIIYLIQSEYLRALELFFKSLRIYEVLGNKQGMATTYSNIGGVYQKQSNYRQALDYHFKSLKMYQELNSKQGIGTSFSNIGGLYISIYQQGESSVETSAKIDSLVQKGLSWEPADKVLLDSALHYQNKALMILRELSDELSITYVLSRIGLIYLHKNDYNTALKHYQQAAGVANSIGALQQESQAHSGLAKCYTNLGNPELALGHFKQYATLKDSIFNEEKSKDLGKLEAKHEFETAEMERKRTAEEQRIKEAAAQSRRDNLQYSGILIFLVLVFAGVFTLGRFSIPIRLAEGLIFFSFLLLFEFTLVLLDPYIETYSSGAPAIKLGFNAVLAGLIFPLHSFFESKLKRRLVKST